MKRENKKAKTVEQLQKALNEAQSNNTATKVQNTAMVDKVAALEKLNAKYLADIMERDADIVRANREIGELKEVITGQQQPSPT